MAEVSALLYPVIGGRTTEVSLTDKMIRGLPGHLTLNSTTDAH
ncbi:MAG: hypothetical protein ACPIA1_05045 [Flavobacteriaceae bacterium]